MQISSTGGTVSLLGTIATNNWTYVSGTVSAGTSTVYLYNGNSDSFKPGPVSYYDVKFLPRNGSGYPVAVTSSLNATHNVTIGAAGSTTVVNMPNPGGAYSFTVGGVLNMAASATLNLYSGSISYGSRTGSGVINP